MSAYTSMKEDEARNEDTDTHHVVEKRSKPKRVASRFFNALLALFFFVLFVLSLVSFSASSNRYRAISGSGGSRCILGATSPDDKSITLGSDGSCRLAIGGEVVIALYAILSIVVMIIKICGGWSM